MEKNSDLPLGNAITQIEGLFEGSHRPNGNATMFRLLLGWLRTRMFRAANGAFTPTIAWSQKMGPWSAGGKCDVASNWHPAQVPLSNVSVVFDPMSGVEPCVARRRHQQEGGLE